MLFIIGFGLIILSYIVEGIERAEDSYNDYLDSVEYR